MGSLRDFDLAKLKERFRLRVLVETGTGEGHSLRYALEAAAWDEVHTIEIDPKAFLSAIESGNERTTLWHGRSSEKLPKIIKLIAGKGPALFWLDAHFPGNLSGVPIDDEKDMSVRLPLEEELRVIVSNRDVSLDLFIIDDAWIYRDGIAACGDWEEREAVTGGATDEFISEILGKTHDLAQDPRANGYTIGVPAHTTHLLIEALGEESASKLRIFKPPRTSATTP